MPIIRHTLTMFSTPTKTTYRVDPASVVGTKRAVDKRAGALCHRAKCVDAALAHNLIGSMLAAWAGHAFKAKVLRVGRDGRIGFKHDRGNTADRASKRAYLVENFDGCAWCGRDGDDCYERDRIISACAYRKENLVPSCKACNNLRNRAATGDDAWSFAQNDAPNREHATEVIAKVLVTYAKWHAD